VALRKLPGREYLVTKGADRPIVLMTLLRDLMRKEEARVLVSCSVAVEAAYWARLAKEVLHLDPVEVHQKRPMLEPERTLTLEGLRTAPSWLVFTAEPASSRERFPLPVARATTVIHVGPPPTVDAYVRRQGATDPTVTSLVAKSIILGVPCEEQLTEALAARMRILKMGSPIPTPKLQARVAEALARRAPANASEEARSEALACWKGWLGYMVSHRSALCCSADLTVRSGNELFGAMFGDPEGAPPVPWGLVQALHMKGCKGLRCISRPQEKSRAAASARSPAPSQTVSPEEQKKKDLLELVRKLRAAEAGPPKRSWRDNHRTPERRRHTHTGAVKDNLIVA